MSWEDDVKQQIRDMLSDGGIYTTQFQFDGVEHLSNLEQKLPCVITSTADNAIESLDFTEVQTSLSFAVRLVDVAGTDDALRKAFEDLALALRRDPTLGNMVRNITVSGWAIQDTAENEYTIAVAAIEATRLDGVPSDTVDIVDFAGRASEITGPSLNDTVEDSLIIPGGIGYTHAGAGTGFPFYTFDVNFISTPIDFTLHPVLRALSYIQPSADGIMVQTRISLISNLAGPLNASTYFHSGNARIGWNHQRIDINNDTPDQQFGTTDFSSIVGVRVQYSYGANNTLPDVILKRIFHYPRDLGSNGHSTGF